MAAIATKIQPLSVILAWHTTTWLPLLLCQLNGFKETEEMEMEEEMEDGDVLVSADTFFPQVDRMMGLWPLSFSLCCCVFVVPSMKAS